MGKSRKAPSRIPKKTKKSLLMRKLCAARKEHKEKELSPPPPQLVLLPECPQPCTSGKQDDFQTFSQPDIDVDIKDEPVEQIVEFIPEHSGPASEEYLPEFEPNASRADVLVPKKNSSGKIFCRLCLEPAAKNQMIPLTILDINYIGMSINSKQNKIMQTRRINNMIRVVMPSFDYGIAYNPIICHKCVARLESAFHFVKRCEENENVIKLYQTTFAPNEPISCDDVAQNKSQLVKQVSSRKKQKTSTHREPNENLDIGRNVSQTGLCVRNSGGDESQENFTPGTSMDLECDRIKREVDDDAQDDNGDSHFMVTTEDLACVVKEEIVVKEDVPCDASDTLNSERLALPDPGHVVKEEEDCLQSEASCVSGQGGHHTNSSNYREGQTGVSVGKKRKLGDAT